MHTMGLRLGEAAYMGLGMMVKDPTRFPNAPGNWGYFSFGHRPPPYDSPRRYARRSNVSRATPGLLRTLITRFPARMSRWPRSSGTDMSLQHQNARKRFPARQSRDVYQGMGEALLWNSFTNASPDAHRAAAFRGNARELPPLLRRGGIIA
jgi:hypothetical protein